jgi:hypothetical protein
MDGLKQRRDGAAAADCEFPLQFADHSLQVAENDRHSRRIGSAADAGGDVAFGPDREPDQLPRRDQPAHHHDQRIRHQVALRAHRTVEHGLDAFELSVGEVADLPRQAGIDGHECVAALQDIEQIAGVLDRVGRADLATQSPPRFIVALGGGEAARIASTTRSWKALTTCSQSAAVPAASRRPTSARNVLVSAGTRSRQTQAQSGSSAMHAMQP